jgi:hypothetical protein
MDGGVHIHDDHGGFVCSEMCVVSCAAIGGGAHLLRLHLFRAHIIVGHGPHQFPQGDASITTSSSLKLSATTVACRRCHSCSVDRSGTWPAVLVLRI